MKRLSRVLPQVPGLLKQNGPDVALFKAILDLKLNSNRPRDTEVISVEEFDGLLKKQLVAAYPEDCKFRKSNGLFKFKDKTSNRKLVDRNTSYPHIVGALGCTAMENIVFDYSQFNPVSLMQLDNDFPHPLWKVLKTTLAISEHFSPYQKIQAYIDVANAYFNKELGHGDRYLGALEMAREAYAVAREYPTPENILLVKNAFMPVYSEKNSEDLATNQQQFGPWIVSECERHKGADVKEIKSELMGIELKPELSLERSKELQEGPIGAFNQQRKVRDAAREALNARLIKSFPTNAMESAVPAVTEFIDYGENFIASMLTFYRILQMMSQQGWLTSREKIQVKEYFDTIEAVVSAYNGLDIPTLFENRSDVTALTIELLNKVNSPAFVSYQTKVTGLIHLNRGVEVLQLQYPVRMWILFDVYMQEFERANYVSGNFHSVRDYTSKSMQCTTKYPILMNPIEKRFKKENTPKELIKLINDATQNVSKNAVNVNEAIRAQENADNTATFARQLAGVEMAQFKKEPKIGLLQAILKLNLNNPKEDSSDAVKEFDAYVKALLVVAYKSSVSIGDNFFQIKANGELCNDNEARLGLMLEALGIEAAENKTGRVVFDPSRFNEEKLNVLIEIDEKNALWLVLKSTMPVTQTFTALDKIETYIDLSGQFFEGNIGDKDKYLGAYAMAEASIAMAKASPSEETYVAVKKAFEPTAEKVADAVLKSLVANKQYGNMILAKHKEHDKIKLKKKDRDEMRALLSSLKLRISEPTLLSSIVSLSSEEEVTSTSMGESISVDTSSGLGEGLPSESLSPIETNDSDNGSYSGVTNLVEEEVVEQEAVITPESSAPHNDEDFDTFRDEDGLSAENSQNDAENVLVIEEQLEQVVLVPAEFVDVVIEKSNALGIVSAQAVSYNLDETFYQNEIQPDSDLAKKVVSDDVTDNHHQSKVSEEETPEEEAASDAAASVDTASAKLLDVKEQVTTHSTLAADNSIAPSLKLRISEPTLLSSIVSLSSEEEVTSTSMGESISVDTSSGLGEGLPSESLSPIETNDSDNGSYSGVTNLVEEEVVEQEAVITPESSAPHNDEDFDTFRDEDGLSAENSQNDAENVLVIEEQLEQVVLVPAEFVDVVIEKSNALGIVSAQAVSYNLDETFYQNEIQPDSDLAKKVVSDDVTDNHHQSKVSEEEAASDAAASVKINSSFSKKFLAIAAGVGAAVCVGAGLALTLTGVFAPLGVGALGLGVAAGVSAVTGVGLGSAFYLIGRKIKSWFGSGSGAGVAKITNDIVAEGGAGGSYRMMSDKGLPCSSSASSSNNAIADHVAAAGNAFFPAGAPGVALDPLLSQQRAMNQINQT